MQANWRHLVSDLVNNGFDIIALRRFAHPDPRYGEAEYRAHVIAAHETKRLLLVADSLFDFMGNELVNSGTVYGAFKKRADRNVFTSPPDFDSLGTHDGGLYTFGSRIERGLERVLHLKDPWEHTDWHGVQRAIWMLDVTESRGSEASLRNSERFEEFLTISRPWVREFIGL